MGCLAFPLVDQRIGASSDAVIEHVAEPGLVGSEQRDDHCAGIRREPADQPDHNLRIVGMGNSPQRVPARLAYPPQRRGIAVLVGGSGKFRS